MKIVFSSHAAQRMQERSVSEEEIAVVIASPEKIGRQGESYIVMKKRENGHLLIVIYRELLDVIKIITVIDTSKVHKYL